MEIIQSLKKFGLSEKEGKVYLSCLGLGETTAIDISIKSNLPRTLIYDILERLINLGLVSYNIKANKKHFTAAEPQELLRILKEKEESIKEILPNLEELQKLKGVKRPKVEVYEGIEGMKTVMDNILKAGINEFLGYGSSKSSFPIIPAFMEKWHTQRVKQKIFMKIIYNDSLEAHKRVNEYKQTLKYAQYKFMPIKANSPTATIIYGNKIALQSWTKEPFAVLIDNEEMAKNQRRYFEELWKIAKL
ncbi:hypothetical protein HYV88_03125 [Candidatus Woesearchaeota archaeon]|nr:hypothetical protein [Candidatus Woesearchaeota archaeon]